MAPKKRASTESPHDWKAIHREALDFEKGEMLSIGQLKKYIEAKAKKLGVQPTMILGSLLSAASNAMNMSQFALTESWLANNNLFILLLANKGSGKTPSGRVFMQPLLNLEKRKLETSSEEEEADDDHLEETPQHKKRKKSMSAGDERDEEQDKFNGGQRIVDSITPEALFLTLYYGNGVLLLKSDEFKSLHDKFMVEGRNISALCSAHSGEDINYTTVKRGPLTIYESRLGIYGSVQPSLFVEMANGDGPTSSVDHQGLWERFIYIPSDMDYDVSFDEQLTAMAQEDLFDVDEFLSSIEEQHQEPTKYTCTDVALQEVKRIKELLKEKNKSSNFGEETMGLTSKAFTNLLKLSSVYACIRLTVLRMEDPDSIFDFIVQEEDVSSAWNLIQYSIHTFEKYKMVLRKEIEEAGQEKANDEEELLDDEQIISSGLRKLVKIYEKADDNKILLSIIKRDSLYPKGRGLGIEVFLEALERRHIAKKVKLVGANHRKVDMIELTTNPNSPEVRRTFELLHDQAQELGINFDPLNLFQQQNDQDENNEIPEAAGDEVNDENVVDMGETDALAGANLMKDLVMKRTTKQLNFLNSILEFCSHEDTQVRKTALGTVLSLYDKGELTNIIEEYSVMYLRFLLLARPPDMLFGEDRGRLEMVTYWTEDIIKVCLYLYMAVLPRNQKLLTHLAEVYVATSGDVKRTVLRIIEPPIREIGMESPELLNLVENCPKGSETLVTRIIHILTERTAPSPELVNKVRDLYAKRVADVRFLIPVLNGLTRQEVTAALPKLIKLNPEVVKKVFNRLLGVGTGGQPGALSPADLLIALHNIDPSKCDWKTIIKATGLCFQEKSLYTMEVLTIVLQQLMEQREIPLLLMRTVIQSVAIYPHLIGFTMNILQRLIVKQVWKFKMLWDGFVKCCQRTKPQSYTVLLQLPPPQLRQLLNEAPDMRELLLEHVQGFTQSQRQHVPANIMEVLYNVDPKEKEDPAPTSAEVEPPGEPGPPGT